MAKKKQSTPPAPKPAIPSAISPVTAAVAATMPLVYSAQIAHSQTTTGPLPPPEFLRQYDEIQSGMADRIVKMAEDEAAHRRTMEAEVIAIQGRDQRAYRRSEILGQVFGLAIGLAAIGGAVVCAVKGAQFAGALLGTAGVTGLVTAFILGRSLLMKQMQLEFEQQRAARSDQSEGLKKAASAKSTLENTDTAPPLLRK